MYFLLGTYMVTFSMILAASCAQNYHEINSENGEIHSPSFPFRYPSNQLVEWNIYSSSGRRLNIHFDAFCLRFSENCDEEYLAIYSEGKLLGKGCGSSLYNKTFVSIGNGIKVIFQTDYHVQDLENCKGFHAKYIAIGANNTLESAEVGDLNRHFSTATAVQKSTLERKQTTTVDFRVSISILSAEVSSVNRATQTDLNNYVLSTPALDVGSQLSSQNQTLTTILITVSIFSILIIVFLSIFIYIETRGRSSRVIQSICGCNRKMDSGNQKDGNAMPPDSQFSDLQSANIRQTHESVMQLRTRDAYYETVIQSNSVDDQKYEVLRRGPFPEYSNTNQIY